MSIADLVYKLVQLIMEFWPIRVVKACQQGVRLRGGRIIKPKGSDGKPGEPEPLRPGFHFVVPFLHEIEVADATEDGHTSWVQTVMSADGYALTVQAAITYHIANYAMFYEQVLEPDEVLSVKIGSAVTRAVGALRYGEEREDGSLTDDLCDAVFEDLSDKFQSWGLELDDVAILSFVEAQSLRLIQQ